MRDRRSRIVTATCLALSATLMVVGAAIARQDPVPTAPTPTPAPAKGTTPKPKAKRGGLLAPGGPKAKALAKDAADPLARPAGAAAPAAGAVAPEPGTFHYALKINAPDGEPFAVKYYPSRLGTGAPVVILVHERESLSRVFTEDKIADLQNQTMAEALQKQGYAALAIDLRGHGANPRRSLAGRDWRLMVGDLQSAYLFLIDRHNRGELNLARLGVVGLGEGANLVATWASLPGGAVSSEGRAGDLAGIVLVSPMIDAQSQGLRALQPMTALAPRVPLYVLAGETDAASADLVRTARPAVSRPRGNKVDLFPASLHGFKLMRLEPKAASSIVRFLDDTLKAKPEEWEPRYNMEPASFGEVQVVPNARPRPADAR